MTERDPLRIVGQVVAEKYRIERLVGEGGFAAVYRAQHTIWNKPVAIKFFSGLSSAPVDHRDHFQRAFIQEGALLTELSSQTAGIVQARDVGTYTTPDGSWMPFMVLEWLDGSSLEAVLEQERAARAAPWTLDGVIQLLGQAAAALDVAHGRGVAHRDVKPANLFVLGEPRGKATLKVLDFGVAKMVTDDTQLQAALARTGMNATSFTPAYGAPEQFSRHHGATGPWTDVFALALVAVEMLGGQLALDGEDIVQLAVSAGHPERRPTPRALGVAVSDAVEAVFAKALSVAPTQRYARAGEFWSALSKAANSSLNPTDAPARISTAQTELAPPTLSPFRALPAPLVSRASNTTGTPSTLTPRASSTPRASAPWRLPALGIALVGGGAGFWLSRSPANPAKPEPTSSSATPAVAAPSPSAPAAVPAPACPERMVKIPAGQFFRGSDAKDARDNEKPAHNVKLAEFCMDLYEVTAGEYKACSDAGRCKRASTDVDWPSISPHDRRIYAPLCTFGDPKRADHPINCVSWELANLYCKANDKRLPTEAEWEYATRGPDGRIYPWGDDPPTEKHLNACGSECVAWGKAHDVAMTALYAESDPFATTAPVGKFEAGRSHFGPYDVVGNVWEWVADWDGAYTAEDQANPSGPATGTRKVIRGGAWNGSFSSWLRPSFRYAQDPKALSHGIGFRCVKSLQQKKPNHRPVSLNIPAPDALSTGDR